MQVADPLQTRVLHDFAHESPLISCRFHPSGQFVFAGAEDSKVWRFTLEGGAKTACTGHESWVRGIGFDKSGQTLLTAGYDGRLVWSEAVSPSPQPLRTVAAHDGWIRALATSPDGTLVATAGNDQHVKIWSIENGSLLHDLKGHEAHVYNVAFHPGGQLVSGDLLGRFIHWDLSSGKEVRKFAAEALQKYDEGFKAFIGGVRGIAFSPQGDTLAASGITNVSNAFAGIGNPLVVLFDWESGKEKLQQSLKEAINTVAWGVRVHPLGFTIAALGGQAGGHLAFWKSDEKNEFHRYALPSPARDLDLNASGMLTATAHYDRHLRVCILAAA